MLCLNKTVVNNSLPLFNNHFQSISEKFKYLIFYNPTWNLKISKFQSSWYLVFCMLTKFQTNIYHLEDDRKHNRKCQWHYALLKVKILTFKIASSKADFIFQKVPSILFFEKLNNYKLSKKILNKTHRHAFWIFLAHNFLSSFSKNL